METLIARYHRIRDALRDAHPARWAEVVRLSTDVPSRVDMQSVWQRGRDKPCFSHIPVSVGQRLADDLKLHRALEDFEIVASDAWVIEFHGSGYTWKQNVNFGLVGVEAREFVASSRSGLWSSYLWRLFAIRSLALALARDAGMQSLVVTLGTWAANNDLRLDRLKLWMQRFRLLAGRGWGVTTVYHMLTDLGVAVKPDIHLYRAAVRMGLVACASDAELRQPSERSQHEAVQRVMELALHVAPTACPDAPSALREVDKVLMEWDLLEGSFSRTG